jgi:pantoate--beta-alanine ligase
MISVETVADLRQQVAQWRGAGQSIALVPTMGNLHQGHLELMRRAQGLADRVIASIFVNPMQFGEGEDLDAYPRTLLDDADKLSSIGVDLLFSPPEQEVYSKPLSEQTIVQVPGLSDLLCGESRPGHFTGVTTVVCKLFNMVQPDTAVFGKKDYQQLMLIRQMCEDLCIPVKIEGLPTVREVDGLARSSRNGYLSDAERSIAPLLYQTLQETARAVVTEDRGGNYAGLEAQAKERLAAGGFRPDYYTIRRAADLQMPGSREKRLVILAAAYLGKSRLIDNLEITLD